MSKNRYSGGCDFRKSQPPLAVMTGFLSADYTSSAIRDTPTYISLILYHVR